MKIELPEPTELLDLRGRPSGFEGYTAAQMRAYGEACAKAEREACAKVCEGFGGNGSGYIDDDWAAMCARAIRAR
jgi:hypothetical protein